MAVCNKFAMIGAKQVNVYNIETAAASQDILVGDEYSAIEINKNGVSAILPIKEKVGDDISKPGVYMDDGPLAYVSFPANEEDQKMYCPTEDKILDMNNISSMQDFVTKKEEYDQTITSLLETDPEDDSVFKPPLLKTDTPEMRALKESIILKGINLDKYASRFGDNYPNDKRKLKDNSITSFMLKRICTNLDMEVDIVFRDAKEDVPNPIGKVVRVNMVPGYDTAISIEDVPKEGET